MEILVGASGFVCVCMCVIDHEKKLPLRGGGMLGGGEKKNEKKRGKGWWGYYHGGPSLVNGGEDFKILFINKIKK